ncbi:hypothetical protein CK489_28375 [Bradyrhizobium sp. UFLA03-84]|uniref:exopolysaccharide biosynthesis polyprenyl glycosylphosphotransferase n=1 Tax=Bradyrhizobium sp. UFLA03-84 TaxID=418599 RepID=UPI000BAE4A43|nr:exopolysaccharide biosynthesis polyprenyl glycosylphosphotransferase [Bradyrhizobium sp. UFLA03-84]PAY06769.1 hypothetical protein CK489_28375 [Bradyrhizobium sp. UFLA03-84]
MQWPTVTGSSAPSRQLGRSRQERHGLTRAASVIETEATTSAKFERGHITEARGSILRSRKKRAGGTEIARREETGANGVLKRLFDLVVGGLAVAFLLVPILLIAIAIVIETPGPALFRQWRGGRGGRRFQILKFRTMTCMEDGVHVRQARPDDARVTRVGRVLRKTSMDELPQLFNVVRGEMSLVGPRPHALVHDAMYSRLITRYAYRHSVKPGMTGWAQVNGCRGETSDLMAMEKRVARDLAYIRHWSVWLDLVIVAMTVREIVRPRNAC